MSDNAQRRWQAAEDRRLAKLNLGPKKTTYLSHRDLVRSHAERVRSDISLYLDGTANISPQTRVSSADLTEEPEEIANSNDSSVDIAVARNLVARLLKVAMHMENEARTLLVDTLPSGSRAEILLRAEVVSLFAPRLHGRSLRTLTSAPS